MVNKYLLHSNSFSGEVILHYNPDGCLIFFEYNAEMTEQQQLWFYNNFPTTYSRLEQIIFKSKTVILKPIQLDLSFQNFWDTYDYKIGHKSRAEKLWNAAKEVEKVMVFENLPAYNYYLNIKKIEKLYPETFLYQRRYEIDYRSLIKKSK